ncbi:MAG: SDR family NAD(P)-dependent oxidoreductase, partial [Anaerolineae bacterium]|nr:SDR family NAD(P)-dependent oxidoreductase [Anaerolineae bacterium]
MNLSGKVALVTGGLGDLGNEMALHLALDGATVAVWDIKSKAEAKERIQRVEFAGGKVLYQKVDISNRKQVDAAVATLVEELGGLDIVCANAGIVEAKPFLEIPQDNWQHHVDVNLTGTFNVG